MPSGRCQKHRVPRPYLWPVLEPGRATLESVVGDHHEHGAFINVLHDIAEHLILQNVRLIDHVFVRIIFRLRHIGKFGRRVQHEQVAHRIHPLEINRERIGPVLVEQVRRDLPRTFALTRTDEAGC